ncbi:hypothetical protein GMW39_14400 [Pectobacterium parmentieri]|uniref:hypothetical protein n=1 Tax=Pectobacterium parmentieri TaxID=1905730 RepID=UPI000EAD3E59|nr:hypothetical protein [Pectobacterium parmentieri]QHQ16925.1 hypothetical protein GMW39_14400 [Pectobacterium parmentieri]RKO82353.1 hypothetical protein C5E04_06200 [Pectobacterium parmentieri]
MKSDKKYSQQSRSSGWGGKRIGAGAPIGNTNAMKHGERSRQAFFPLSGDNGRFTPLQLLRVRNLLLAERVGELMHSSLSLGTAAWRGFMRLDGILWQHTRKMMVLERRKAKLNLQHSQH